jgi:hypothetical protein
MVVTIRSLSCQVRFVAVSEASPTSSALADDACLFIGWLAFERNFREHAPRHTSYKPEQNTRQAQKYRVEDVREERSQDV